MQWKVFYYIYVYSEIVNANLVINFIIAGTYWNRAARSRQWLPLPSTRTAWPSSGRWQRYSSTRGSSAKTSVMSLLPVRNKRERCTYAERKYKKAFLPRFIWSWHFLWFISWYLLTSLGPLWLEDQGDIRMQPKPGVNLQRQFSNCDVMWPYKIKTIPYNIVIKNIYVTLFCKEKIYNIYVLFVWYLLLGTKGQE